MLNNEIDFMTRANSKLNPIAPQSGIILIGNNGFEFRSEKVLVLYKSLGLLL